MLYVNNSRAESGFCRLFNYKYGFTDKSINSIVKDKNGIIWLGTESGLVKFDGVSFCKIVPNINKYIDSEIRVIKQSENKLFLLYKNKGCLTYDLNTFRFVELDQNQIADLEPVTDYIYYSITYSGYLFKNVGSKKIFINKFTTTANNAKLSFFENKLFLVNQKGIYKIDFNTNEILNHSENIHFNYRSQFSKSNKYLHYITKNAVYKIDSIDNKQKISSVYPVNHCFPEKVTFYQYINNKDYYYIYNYRKIIRGEITKNDDIRTIYDLNLHQNLQLKTLCSFDANNLIVGTNQGLLWVSKYSSKIAQLNDNSQFDSIVRVRRSILQLENNNLLFFGYPSLIQFDPKKNSYEVKINKSTFYNSVAVNNQIYSTTNDYGLVRLDKDLKGFAEVLVGYSKSNLIVGLCYDSVRKVILAGGVDFIVIYNPNKKDNNITKLNFKSGLVKVILCDYINNIYWLGTENGVFGIDTKGEIKYQLNSNNSVFKISNNSISDLLLFKNNSELWIANKFGIEVFNIKKNNNIFTLPIHPDIISNPVALESDSLNRIWIATYQGLLLVNPHTYVFQHFDKEVHTINNEFNFTSSEKLKSGKIIFGGLNGYDIVNPKEFSVIDEKYKISISSVFKISKDDTVQCQIKNNQLQYDSDKEYLKIYVHNNNIIKDLNFNYEYAIDDNTWIQTNSLAQIIITDLHPGKHVLKIRSLENLLYSNQVIELNIISYIPFFKSSLFSKLIIVLLLLLITLYLIAMRNVRLVKSKTKAQIAMDLHDEVGTLLTRALFYSKSKKDSQMSNLLETALNSLRAYLYSMSKKKTQLIDLVDDFREMLNFVSISSNSKLEFKVSDLKNKIISSMLFRDLKLMLYEITTNIQKHSYCNFIEAEIKLSKNTLFISITDDGVLSDIDKIYYKGNGIENMQKRIKAHKGTISFQLNKFTTGLKVEITVPLK